MELISNTLQSSSIQFIFRSFFGLCIDILTLFKSFWRFWGYFGNFWQFFGAFVYLFIFFIFVNKKAIFMFSRSFWSFLIHGRILWSFGQTLKLIFGCEKFWNFNHRLFNFILSSMGKISNFLKSLDSNHVELEATYWIADEKVVFIKFKSEKSMNHWKTFLSYVFHKW